VFSLPFFAGYACLQKTRQTQHGCNAQSYGAVVLKLNSSVKVAGPGRLKNLFGPVYSTGKNSGPARTNQGVSLMFATKRSGYHGKSLYSA
jgi:hypothetical protein